MQETEQGDQVITVRTGIPGKLVLHWGVEGGAQSKNNGWVLPPDSCRPEGTVQYKKRALQTPFKWAQQQALHVESIMQQRDDACGSTCY